MSHGRVPYRQVTTARPSAANCPAAAGGGPTGDGAVAAAQALADGTRLRLLMLLGEGEAVVAELVARLKVPQPNVSHHLAILRGLGAVESRRDGRSIVYRLLVPPPVPGAIRVSSGGATVTITPFSGADG